MLINCPECGKQISSKAVMCIGCGCPIGQIAPVNEPNRVRKWHRLPNGFGTIRKLSGHRRKPYACYPPVTDYKDNGTPVQNPAIGYFETWQKAYDALAFYNKNPYDLSNVTLTFAEVYEKYYQDKYENNKKRVYSDASKYSTQSAFLNFSAIHNKSFKDLRTNDYQSIIDNSPLKHSSLELMQLLIKQMYKFALKVDLVEKDYGQFVKINIPDDDEKGVPFTESEIQNIWDNAADNTAQILLVLIYTGMRISEYKKANIDVEKGVIVTGVKTEAGKNRTIPIHDGIKEIVTNLNNKDFVLHVFRKDLSDLLDRIGISTASTGEKHTPHDCRHTFSWLCDKYNVDKLAKHMIMGHSLKGLSDIEMSVYGHRTDEELKQEIMKIEVKKGAK